MYQRDLWASSEPRARVQLLPHMAISIPLGSNPHHIGSDIGSISLQIATSVCHLYCHQLLNLIFLLVLEMHVFPVEVNGVENSGKKPHTYSLLWFKKRKQKIAKINK